MIDLYYWGTPNGHKITIALEEMGLEYQIFPVNILENDQFQPDFLRISPNNKIPAIVDQDGPRGEAISVFQVLEQFCSISAVKPGLSYPVDEQQRVEVEQWLMWQMGGLGPMLGQNHHFSRFAPEKIPYAIDRYVAETKRLYGVLNKQLIGREVCSGRVFDCRYGYFTSGYFAMNGSEFSLKIILMLKEYVRSPDCTSCHSESDCRFRSLAKMT